MIRFADENHSIKGVRSAASPRPELEPIDLLLVDDRRENLLALEAVLASPGYNLILTTSGDEALRYLLDHEPALILMDVQMPNLDGFETATLIKRSERTCDIPIIFVTAINKDERYAHDGYSHGAVDYIHKPYDPHVLRSKVAVFADLARKTQRLVRAEKKLFESEAKDRERQIAQLELKSLRREQIEQKKYRDLVDGINHGVVWAAHPDTLLLTFVSASAQRILGYSSDTWLDENHFLINRIHPDDRDNFITAIKKLRADKKEISLEHRMIAQDNRTVWLHTGIRIGMRGDAEHTELRGLSIDITQAKESELRIKQSKKRSDFLAQASLLLSESLDCDKSLSQLGTLAVPELAEWCSIDVLEDSNQIRTISQTHSDPKLAILGPEKSKLYPYDLCSQFGANGAIKTGKSILYSGLLDLDPAPEESSDPTGNAFFREWRNLGIRSAMIVPLIARGKTFGAITLFSTAADRNYDEHDLSMAEDLARRASFALDNADLYKRAQSAIQARDEFLSIASHELKTPLTPLKIQTQALMRTLRTKSIAEIQTEKLEKMLQISERQLGRLSKLIDDLLDVSRISNGKLCLNLEEFDVVELIHDIIDRFCAQLLAASCEVSFDAVEPILVKWDRLRTEQVVTNLLSNAMKYGAGKPILVNVRHENHQVRIAFADRGIGIAPEDQVRVFKRFERVMSRSHVSGLGLGLYIVKQILEAHGGTISVKSELGVGSDFVIDMPQQVLEEMTPPPLN